MWDHEPDPNELLAARLASGWRPTPSRLKAGDVVLGHAACALVRGENRGVERDG